MENINFGNKQAFSPLLAADTSGNCDAISYRYKKGAYEPTFESLQAFECPDWFRDAKFGIWSHWGAQSVAMNGDWYARRMYKDDTPQFLYHRRVYGHPSEFGYLDLAKSWKAEAFDPEGLMSLYVKAGAKYFMGQAMHHDHFFNYPSKLNKYNSVNMGPGKDITGMWQKAAKKHGLPFGFSEHLGATYTWFCHNKKSDSSGIYKGVPYDGNKPEYRDFYLEGHDGISDDVTNERWYTTNHKWHTYWHGVVAELVEMYKPDLLYSDGALPFGVYGQSEPTSERYAAGLSAVANYYNTVPNGIYLQKDRRPEIYTIGVLDIEKSQLPDISPHPWHTDTCIGNWFYDAHQPYKTPKQIIEMLVDIVSKNGNMLLNILQKPDGSIDDEALYILEELAAWFDVCGSGIHGTRPWRVYREGDSSVVIDGFKENAVVWNSSDFRFTKKGNVVYAFMMDVPENRVAVVKSFTMADKVAKVTLLGHGDVAFAQEFGVLSVKLPEQMPVRYANCLAINIG